MSTYSDNLLPVWPVYVAMAVLVACLVVAVVLAMLEWLKTRDGGRQESRRPPLVRDRDATPSEVSGSPAVVRGLPNRRVSGYAQKPTRRVRSEAEQPPSNSPHPHPPGRETEHQRVRDQSAR